jgi:Glycosyl transferase family 11
MVGRLTMELVGGLGNQLFQLAALMHIASKTGRRPYLQSLTNPSPHSSVSYFDTVFWRFRPMLRSGHTPIRIEEQSIDWRTTFRLHPDVCLAGYFQDWRYADADFVRELLFPTGTQDKYEGIKEGIFLHIRGGDYVNNPYHDLKLDAYYERAIAMFPGAHFFVVTNDVGYAMSRPFMATLKHTLVMEPELDILFLMSQCAGGICANSSFSWWGAFLNPHRKIIMPDRWYPHTMASSEGYYFPGVIKCPV